MFVVREFGRVCVRVRACVGVRVRVWVCAWECARVVCACVCARARALLCVYVCVRMTLYGCGCQACRWIGDGVRDNVIGIILTARHDHCMWTMGVRGMVPVTAGGRGMRRRDDAGAPRHHRERRRAQEGTRSGPQS